MNAHSRKLDPSKVDQDTPLRLADAVELAFPMGGMTVSGLKLEASKGRLVIEVIAGKQFTTLAAIKEMRRQCLEAARAPASTSEKNGETPRETSPTAQPGSFGTGNETLPQAALRMKLEQRSASYETTSRRSTSRGVRSRTSSIS